MQDLQCFFELLNGIIYVVEVKLTDSVLSSLLCLSYCFIVIRISFDGSTATCWSIGLLLMLHWLRWLMLSIRVLDGRRLVVRVLLLSRRDH